MADFSGELLTGIADTPLDEGETVGVHKGGLDQMVLGAEPPPDIVINVNTKVFEARVTKMDKVLRNLPKLYTQQPRSVLRNVLQAFLREDDSIGGSRSDFLE